MKKLIIILLLCWMGVTGFSQVISDETLFVPKEPAKTYIDTIPILMLVCDTITIKNISYSMNGLPVGGWAFWMKGYEIREHYWSYHPDYMIMNEQMSIRNIVYLDAEKKPLNKNIVVWISLNIK
jgi:hypothetical protein